MKEQSAEGTEFETKYLESLKEKCNKLHIPTRWVSKEEIMQKEPFLRASVALASPETGIIDSHGLMDFLSHQIDSLGGQQATRTTLIDSEPTSAGFRLTLAPSDQLNDTI